MSSISYSDARPLSPVKVRARSPVYAPSYGNMVQRSPPPSTSYGSISTPSTRSITRPAVSPTVSPTVASALSPTVARSISTSARSPSPTKLVSPPLVVSVRNSAQTASTTTLPSRSSLCSSNGTSSSARLLKRLMSGVPSPDKVVSSDVIVHRGPTRIATSPHPRLVQSESNASSPERQTIGALHSNANGSSVLAPSGSIPTGMGATCFSNAHPQAGAGEAFVATRLTQPPPRIGVATSSMAGSHGSRLSGSHGSRRSTSPRADGSTKESPLNGAQIEGSPQSGDESYRQIHKPIGYVPSKREPLWRSLPIGQASLAAACEVLQGLLDQKTLGPNEKEDIQFCLERVSDAVSDGRSSIRRLPSKSPDRLSRSNSMYMDRDSIEPLDDQTAAWLASLTGGGKKISFRQVGLTIMAGRRLLSLNKKTSIDLSRCGYDVPDGPLRDLCKKLDLWNDFDIFKVTELAGSGAISLLHVSTLVLQAHGLVGNFGIDMEIFRKFTMKIGQSYKDNPYHNAMHAADVVQTLHTLMLNTNGKPFSELEQLSAFAAALCHDVGHEGLTNPYHINAQTALAVTYSDTSCNENMHLAMTWGILSEASHNWMKIFLNDQRTFVKKAMIQIIIATDMANHFSNLQKFNEMIEAKGRDVTRWNDPIRALEHLVHSADVSNVGKPMRLAHLWTDRVLEEFFAQGDREREMGLPISNLCDRYTVSRYASQVGFVNFIVKPLFVGCKEITRLREPLDNMDEYVTYNKAELEKENAKKAREADNTGNNQELDETQCTDFVEEASGSESDLETNEEPPEFIRPRRVAVCGSKCGHWNRRTMARHGNPPIHPKTQKQHALLRQAILDDPIFESAVAYGHLDTLAAAIVLEPVYAGQTVVEQGQRGEADYFVVEGNFDCFSADSGSSRRLVAQCEPGQHFGDDVLLWQSEWDFTVSASSSTQPSKPALVGRLDRRVYLNTLVFGNIREFHRKLRCLKRCHLFEYMSDEQMSKMVEVLSLKFYRPGDKICSKGCDASHLFVLESGECKVQGGSTDRQVLRAGDTFGERALLEQHDQEETVMATTEVEMLVLSRRKFRRLFGNLSVIQAKYLVVDPRTEIASLLKRERRNGGTGPNWGTGPNSDFAIFRPCSRDAMSKLVNGVAVGKTCNIKGKAAKNGALAGYIPFLQIFDNAHKVDIELSPKDGRTLIYYKSEHARVEAYRMLQGCLLQVMMTDRFPIQEPEIKFENSYAPHLFGLDLPEPLVHEMYIERQDLQPSAGWETGRESDPAFMDVNLHATRDIKSKPRVVLLQIDVGEPMNPHGLLMSYAEESVKPVVAGLDPFIVGSKGLSFAPLPPEQLSLAMWTVNRASEIVEDKSGYSWTDRWLAVLHDVANDGIHHDMPPGGYGDDVSKDFVRGIMQQTAATSAVRGPLECFNFHFPHELCEEFLIIWNGFDGRPWRVVKEAELREFLNCRISDGYCFPVNPVWAIRDAGWYDIMNNLRKTSRGRQALETWYPQTFGILSKIDATWDKHPEGFNTTNSLEDGPKCCTSQEQVALILHETKRKSVSDVILRKEGSALEPVFSSESVYQRIKQKLMRFMPRIS